MEHITALNYVRKLVFPAITTVANSCYSIRLFPTTNFTSVRFRHLDAALHVLACLIRPNAVFNRKWQNMENSSCFISTASDKHGACLTWWFFTRSQQSSTYWGVSNLNVLLQTSSTMNFSCHYICFSLQFFISLMVWVPAHLRRNAKMSFCF